MFVEGGKGPVGGGPKISSLVTKYKISCVVANQSGNQKIRAGWSRKQEEFHNMARSKLSS